MLRLLLLFTIVSCNSEPRPPKEKICKIVLEVGGCDEGGQCGVRFEDGTTSDKAMRPAPGMNLCVQHPDHDYEYWISEVYWDYMDRLERNR